MKKTNKKFNNNFLWYNEAATLFNINIFVKANVLKLFFLIEAFTLLLLLKLYSTAIQYKLYIYFV